MAIFPSSLTEEEEALQKKYAKLKKKVRTITLVTVLIICFQMMRFVTVKSTIVKRIIIILL